MTNPKTNFYSALRKAISEYRTWSEPALGDVRLRYKRSFLGPLWLTLGTAILLICLGLLWSRLWGADLDEYFPYLVTGLVTWNYVSSILSESSYTFISNAQTIKNTRVDLLAFPLRVSYRQLLVIAHQLPIIPVVLLYFDIPITLISAMSLVGVLLIFLNSLWISLLIGMLAARLRDISFIVETVLPLMFFMSPILWRVRDLGDFQFVVDFNPIAHVLRTIRDPLLHQTIPMDSFIVVSGILLAGICASFIAYRHSPRIVFWVQ